MRSLRGRALPVIALVLIGPAVLFAHGVLRKSEPANGALLRVAPRVIRLTFSEPPQLAFTEVELIGPDSQRVVLSELRAAAPDSTAIVVADVMGPLRAGRYRITWQITSADGHPVRGTVAFRIAADASGLARSPMDSAATAALPAVAPDTTAPPEATSETAPFGVGSWPYAVIRLLSFGAILVVIGAVVFALIVVPATHHRVPDLGADFVVEARHRAARAALVATSALALLVAARFIAQSYAIQGAFPDASFFSAATRTPWGWGLMLAGASVAAVVIALARPARASWSMAAVGILGLALATALSGHAVASGKWTVGAVLASVVHVLAAGGWLGALLLVLVAGVPATARLEPLGRGLAVRGMVDAFSPMALTFAAALAITGIVAAVLRIGAWSALTTTDYGRVFLWKIGGVVLVLLAGAYNWKRLRPAIDANRVGTLRRTAALELALGFLVLIMTAWLVATPPPTE
ncbi:MAG TPA: copper resistance protein CopC [Gemmatimonadaceae bacterium]|nr:copper resistance protein CopC [Gemmatimonadaceae bacterium]